MTGHAARLAQIVELRRGDLQRADPRGGRADRGRDTAAWLHELGPLRVVEPVVADARPAVATLASRRSDPEHRPAA